MKTDSQSFFLQNNEFFESKADGCVLFSHRTVHEVKFIAFEIVKQDLEPGKDNLAYKNDGKKNETSKLLLML